MTRTFTPDLTKINTANLELVKQKLLTLNASEFDVFRWEGISVGRVLFTRVWF